MYFIATKVVSRIYAVVPRTSERKIRKVEEEDEEDGNPVRSIHDVYLVKEITEASASLSGTSIRNTTEILVFHLNEFCKIRGMKLVYASTGCFIVQEF